MFEDRTDAGKQLVKLLDKFKTEKNVILALPRGGVLVAAEVADYLKSPLDLAVVKKIGHPFNPEYAICAVSEDNDLICNDAEIPMIDQTWLGHAIKEKTEEARTSKKKFLNNNDHLDLKNRNAIIIDDGVATGLTLRAAIAWAKKQNPKKLIVAVPVVPEDIAEEIKKEVDEFYSVLTPAYFLGSVGTYYNNFEQVNDDDVIRILNQKKGQ